MASEIAPHFSSKDAVVCRGVGKTWAAGTDFVVGDAVAHIANLPTASVDGILASYLLRNVPDREKLVTEMVRVLRPGGTLVVHDYSVAGSLRARATWAVMCHALILPLAAVKRSDVELHRYLYRSVRDFDWTGADTANPRWADRTLDLSKLDTTPKLLRHNAAASLLAAETPHEAASTGKDARP